MDRKKTSKTISIIASVAIAVAAMGIFYSASGAVPSTLQRDDDLGEGIEPLTVQKPNEIPFRTGIPTLNSYEIPNLKTLSYYEIKEGQYEYLDRAIRKGVALISDSEMDEYFNTFSEKGYHFAMTFKDGTQKYYRILFMEPPLSLSGHYVNVFVLDNQIPSAKALPDEHAAYLQNAIDREYRWIPIDEKSALELNALADRDGRIFNISSERGNETARLMYLGAFSEELERPEFQAMYPTVASTGGQ